MSTFVSLGTLPRSPRIGVAGRSVIHPIALGTLVVTAILPWIALSECSGATLLRVVENGREHTLEANNEVSFEPTVRFEERDFHDRLSNLLSGGECRDCVVNEVSLTIRDESSEGGLWEINFSAGESGASGLLALDVGTYEIPHPGPCTQVLGNNSCPPFLSLEREWKFDFGETDFVGRISLGAPNRFEILESEYGPYGEVLRFAANFELVNNLVLDGDPLVVGQLRYNSTAPSI